MAKKEQKSLYIIGDVHGCYDTLMALIKKLPNPDAHLVFVGDLLDRGDKSAQVIEYVKTHGHDCVLGNHELMMIEALKNMGTDGSYYRDWKTKNGGLETLQSYKDSKHDIKEHLGWLESLPHYLEFESRDENGYKLLITHGAGLPFYDMIDTAKDEVITNRVMQKNSYKIINVFGHNPFDAVKFYENYIGIDTGCVYGKKGKMGILSALEWPSKQVYQQAYRG